MLNNVRRQKDGEKKKTPGEKRKTKARHTLERHGQASPQASSYNKKKGWKKKGNRTCKKSAKEKVKGKKLRRRNKWKKLARVQLFTRTKKRRGWTSENN